MALQVMSQLTSNSIEEDGTDPLPQSSEETNWKHLHLGLLAAGWGKNQYCGALL